VIRQELPEPSDVLIKHVPGHGYDRATADSGRQELVETFSHLVIGVSDLDRSEAFYRDILGLDLLGRNLTAEERPHSVLRLNAGHLFILVESEDAEPARPGSQATHHAFALTPNQFRRAKERLEAHGYPTADFRQQFRALGEYCIDVTDPDGHHYQIEADGPEASRIVLPGAGVVDCGAASDYEVGAVRPFKEGNFFLVRLAEGFLAMTRWCTHMNGTPVYQPEHHRFWCPQHSRCFDRHGEQIGPLIDAPPLRLNAVKISGDGRVLVDTDVVIERERFHPGQAVRPSGGSGGGKHG